MRENEVGRKENLRDERLLGMSLFLRLKLKEGRRESVDGRGMPSVSFETGAFMLTGG